MTDLPDLRARFSAPGRFAAGVDRAVFDAVETKSGRRVYLHVAANEVPDAKRALQQACSQLAVVQHPSFSTVLACGRAELDGRDTRFLATPWMRGTPLREQRLKDREARPLLLGMLEGLELLHASGGVHGGIAGALQIVDGRLFVGRLPVFGAGASEDVLSLLDEVRGSLASDSALRRELRSLRAGAVRGGARSLARQLRANEAPCLALAS